MGSSTSQEEVKAKEQEQITDTSNGTHLIEIHASSMGMGAFTVIAIIMSLGCMLILYKKCLAKESHSRGRRSRHHSYNIRDVNFGFGSYGRPAYPSHHRALPQTELAHAQFEAFQSLVMQPQPQPHYDVRHDYSPRHFEEMEMGPMVAPRASLSL